MNLSPRGAMGHQVCSAPSRIILRNEFSTDLTKDKLGATYILSASGAPDFSNGFHNFVTVSLCSDDEGFFVYVKNNTFQNIVVSNNEVPITGVQNILWRNDPEDPGSNTSISILYWTGDTLIMY